MLKLFKIDAAAAATAPQEIFFKPDGSTTTIAMQQVKDITAGTLSLSFAQQGSNIYETPTGVSTIDLSTPKSVTVVDATLGGVKISLSGYVGTATELFLVVSTQ